ncbi:MAG: ferritin family protein [Acidobacteriaceae bacterium]
MELLKIYEFALNREYEGKRFFEENASRLSHAAAVSAFQQLAGEEQKHIDFIRKQVELVNQGQESSVDYGVMLDRGGFFSQRAQSELIDQSIAEAMVPDLPVLRMAYLIERDFVEFYEKSALQTSGEGRKVLEILAKWERIHEALFKGLYDRAYESYSQMPWGG